MLLPGRAADPVIRVTDHISYPLNSVYFPIIFNKFDRSGESYNNRITILLAKGDRVEN